MFCEKISGAFNFLKRLLPLIPGMVLLIIINYCLCLKEPYLQISWLFVCFLVFILCIGVNKFSLGAGSLQITLEKAKATQNDLESTLGIVMKILARIADSEPHRNLLPWGGRTYIYNLIHKILSNSFYSEADKNELIRDSKWVLLKWLFSRIERELTNTFPNDTLIKDRLKIIKNELKDILNNKKYDFYWLRSEVMKLSNKDISDSLSKIEKTEYKDVLKVYQRMIEDFICSSTIPEKFLDTGKRD